MQTKAGVLTACNACTALHPTEAASHTLVGVAAPSGSVSATNCLPLQAAQPPWGVGSQHLTSLWKTEGQTHLLTPTLPRQDWGPSPSTAPRQACLNNCMPARTRPTAGPPGKPQAIINMPGRGVKLIGSMAH